MRQVEKNEVVMCPAEFTNIAIPTLFHYFCSTHSYTTYHHYGVFSYADCSIRYEELLVYV